MNPIHLLGSRVVFVTNFETFMRLFLHLFMVNVIRHCLCLCWLPLPHIYKSLNFQEPKPLMWERIKYDDRFRKVFTKFSIRILFSTKTFKSKNLSVWPKLRHKIKSEMQKVCESCSVLWTWPKLCMWWWMTCWTRRRQKIQHSGKCDQIQLRIDWIAASCALCIGAGMQSGSKLRSALRESRSGIIITSF